MYLYHVLFVTINTNIGGIDCQKKVCFLEMFICLLCSNLFEVLDSTFVGKERSGHAKSKKKKKRSCKDQLPDFILKGFLLAN
jgi:hypothetical protein